MKYLITLKSGFSVLQDIEVSMCDVLSIYGVGKPLLRTDGTVCDVIAKIELVVERADGPNLYLDMSEQITYPIVEEVSRLDQPLIWDAGKFRYVAENKVLSNGLVCCIEEMTNDVSEIHVRILTREQMENVEFIESIQLERAERFAQMTVNGLVDVIKANYLNFLGTIYSYIHNDESEDMQPYLEAVQQLMPVAVLLTKQPFAIYYVVSDGVLKILLHEREDGQIGIEFMKERNKEI